MAILDGTILGDLNNNGTVALGSTTPLIVNTSIDENDADTTPADVFAQGAKGLAMALPATHSLVPVPRMTTNVSSGNSESRSIQRNVSSELIGNRRINTREPIPKMALHHPFKSVVAIDRVVPFATKWSSPSTQFTLYRNGNAGWKSLQQEHPSLTNSAQQALADLLVDIPHRAASPNGLDKLRAHVSQQIIRLVDAGLLPKRWLPTMADKNDLRPAVPGNRLGGRHLWLKAGPSRLKSGLPVGHPT